MLDDNKSIWCWAMYDWANSAFATTVMAGFFPLSSRGTGRTPTPLPLGWPIPPHR